MEHGLPEKSPAESHAVKAARELPVEPRFDGVGKTSVVEIAVGAEHVVCNPGHAPRPGAVLNNPPEAEIHGEGERRFLKITRCPFGKMIELRQENAARGGGPPEHGISLVEPWENALPVRCEQHRNGKIAALAEGNVITFLRARGET